jgi:hypothetical protein
VRLAFVLTGVSYSVSRVLREMRLLLKDQVFDT